MYAKKVMVDDLPAIKGASETRLPIWKHKNRISSLSEAAAVNGMRPLLEASSASREPRADIMKFW